MRAYVSVLITDTVPVPVLATYSRLPSGLSASAPGEEPTVMSIEKILLGLASMRWPVTVFITETVSLPVLATYSRWPCGAYHHSRRSWCPPQWTPDCPIGSARHIPIPARGGGLPVTDVDGESVGVG